MEANSTKISVSIDTPNLDETHCSKSQRGELGKNNTSSLGRDPSLHFPICSYHVNEQDVCIHPLLLEANNINFNIHGLKIFLS